MFRYVPVHPVFLKERYSDVPFNVGLFSWRPDGQLTLYMSYYRDDARAFGRAMGKLF
jgi:hypothetical protein